MVYENENSENVTKISKTALKDFYEIRGLLHTIHHNETQDTGNKMRVEKRDVNVERGIKICEKWINDNPPIELD